MTTIELWEALASIDRPAVSHGIDEALDLMNDYLDRRRVPLLTIEDYPSDGSIDSWGIRRPSPWTLRSASVRLGDRDLIATPVAPLNVASGSPEGRGSDVALSILKDPSGSVGCSDVVGVLPSVTDATFRWEGWAGAAEECAALITSVVPRRGYDGELVGRLELPRQWPCPVFVLSPASYDSACHSAEEGRRVGFHCEVDVSPLPLRVASATVSGPATQSAPVLVVAHSCHRAPNAIDNASGLAVWAQAIASVHRARTEGGLAGIGAVTFIACPEITGTAAFLQRWGCGFGAGLVFDMMTHRREDPALLTVDLPPSYLPGAADVRAGVKNRARTWSGPSVVSDFDGTSDHLLLNDPRVNVPAVRFGYLDDPKNHSDGDTCETASPNFLLAWEGRVVPLVRAVTTTRTRVVPTPLGVPFEPRSFLESLSCRRRHETGAAIAALGHSRAVRVAHLHALGYRGDALLQRDERLRGGSLDRTSADCLMRALDDAVD